VAARNIFGWVGRHFKLSHLHPAARQFCRSTYTITDITIK
jgi:hypothetical protein